MAFFSFPCLNFKSFTYILPFNFHAHLQFLHLTFTFLYFSISTHLLAFTFYAIYFHEWHKYILAGLMFCRDSKKEINIFQMLEQITLLGKHLFSNMIRYAYLIKLGHHKACV